MMKQTMLHPRLRIPLRITQSKLPIRVTAQMNPKGVRLSENSQSPKLTLLMTPFLGESQNDKTIDMENIFLAALGQGGDRQEGVGAAVRGQHRGSL